MRILSSLFFAATLASGASPDLEAPYAQLKTLSCDVERISKVPEGELRILSRVFYRAPNELLIENFSPGRRKILSDGKTLYFHDASFAKGFKQEINRLDDWWKAQIANIPATPFEHLYRLKGIEPKVLDGGENGRQLGYAASNAWVEVQIDEKGLLQTLDLFEASDRSVQVGHVEYQAPQEIAGVPVFTGSGAWKKINDQRVDETLHFRNIRVNEPMADRLFDPKVHFSEVEFVDEYSKTLQ